MKVTELRSVRAVVAAGYHVTAAADALHTSQPGISRHVQNVEESLGVELFTRHRHRLAGPTEAGRVLLPAIDRVLESLDGLQTIATQFVSGARGRLTIATSHTHARYLLPPALERFIGEAPDVQLQVRQGSLDQIVEWMRAGTADLSLSAVPAQPPAELEFRPLCTVHRVVLVPRGHALVKGRRLTLQSLARFPIITYGTEFAAYAQIAKAFADAGLTPSMALNTNDTDTIKTYALCGLGVAIVAHTAYSAQRDKGLLSLDAAHLFPSSVVSLGTPRDRPTNKHASRLADLLADQAPPASRARPRARPAA